MTTPNKETTELVYDRIARIMLDESADEPNAEILELFAGLDDHTRALLLLMGRIYKDGGALADELHGLFDAGDMAAVNTWLEAHYTMPD